MKMMSERTKFHPIVLLVYFIRELKNWLFLFFLLLVDLDNRSIYTLLALSAILALILIRVTIKYNTQTYQISSEKIVVYRGIFKKKETEITYDRIQTVKQRQWFFFQPFNVVEVLIETASSTPGEAEASLTAVDLSLVETIESYRNKTGLTEPKTTEEDPENPSDVRFHLGNKDIGLYALTDVTAILVVGTVTTFVLEWLPDSLFTGLGSIIDYFQGALIILLALIGLSLIAIASLLKSFMLFYNYNASLDQDTLTIEYGLFERKTQKIPLSKIQGVKVHKQLIRNFFKRSSVELIIMGGQEKEGDGVTLRKLYLFPLIHDNSVYTKLNAFLPDRSIEEQELTCVSNNRLWYFWRWILLIGIPLVIAAFIIHIYLGIGAVVTLIIGLVSGWKKSQEQGFTIQHNDLLCLQNFQGLSTVQLYIAQKNIQAFEQSTTLWLAKKKLGHLKVTFKEGEIPMGFELHYIAQADSSQIYNEFWQK